MGVDAEHRGVVIEIDAGGSVAADSARQGLPVVVVGGGPAGLMAAEVIAASGQAVVVFEAMPSVGRKLLMAGRGGLNLTHSEALEVFLGRYGVADSRIERAIRDFPPGALIGWAEALGQATFVGSSGRVFPKAMKASPLVRAWLERLRGLGVEIRTRHRLEALDAAGRAVFATPQGTRQAVDCRGVVLALGGASWPRLGSDGRWVELLAERGVAIAPLRAANAGVQISWSTHYRERFVGAPLKRIAVQLGSERRRGEVVISANGLEGGGIYGLVPAIRAALEDGSGSLRISLDLRPDESISQLAERLGRPRGKQSMATWLRKTVQLAPAAIGLLREASPGGLPAEAEGLARLIKAVPLEVAGLNGLERAISSAGGVRSDAIDENFMLVGNPGVFVAGEMLDWEAPTGGYLLQGVMATGRAAGLGVGQWLRAQSVKA